jgi:hypothetical protein
VLDDNSVLVDHSVLVDQVVVEQDTETVVAVL